MNTIIVEYDTFSYESKATIYTDTKECDRLSIKSNVKDMASQIVEYAHGNNIYDIRFHGPELIRKEFAINVRDIEKNLYSEDKITVREI